MTLDSKHSAGSATVATGGVPRIQELLSYSKSINTPQKVLDKIGDESKTIANLEYLKSYGENIDFRIFQDTNLMF